MKILFSAGIISSTLLAGCAALPPAQQDDGPTIGLLNTITAVTPPLAAGTQPTAIGHDLRCDGVIKYLPQITTGVASYTQKRIGTDGRLEVKEMNWPGMDEEDRNAKIHRLLPNIASNIAVKETKTSVDLGGLFSGKTRRYIVTIDFAKYRTDPVYAVGSNSIGANSIPVYYSRVGAGLRIHYQIDTIDAGLNLSDLLGIAASVKAGRTKGELTTAIVGMQSSEITLISPITEDISDSSVRRLIEALATIKAKMHEADAFIDPHFLAYVHCDNSAIEES